MTIAVDVSDFVQTSVVISPLAIPYSSFGIPMIAGDSNVIDTTTRYRQYTTIAGVAQDFGTTAPEYLAATVYFSQQPQPALCMIGRWARVATSGQLIGTSLTPTQQTLSNFTAITTGSLSVNLDGSAKSITGLDLHLQTNLNGVATVIQTALNTAVAGTTCTWNSVYGQFRIVSASTGNSSSVTITTTNGTGIDISSLLGLAPASNPLSVGGMTAETALACATALAGVSAQWYSLTFASSTMPVTSDYVAVAGMILASNRSRIFGVTVPTTDCLNPGITNDLASQLQALNNRRVYWWYDPANPYGVMTLIGRAGTVNFAGSLTTITLAYKQAPGLNAAYLTETQFATLVAKGGNCNVAVDNGALMIWPGQMANGTFFDEVQGLDWQANDIQVGIFNLLYQSQTKIPQTDAGNALIATVISNACEDGVNNGLCAPGQWNGPNIGSLQTGHALSAGYYVYYPPIATQSQAARETRASVPFQVAYKLAGAIHTVDCVINVNR